MTASCVYLWILRGFSEHFFHRASPGNCYCMSKLQNSTKYSKKLLHTGSFQAFCTRSRSSHSKVFIYLRSLKTKKKLICNEVARCHPVILRKKHFHTSSYFLPSFSQNASRLLLSKRLWKCMSTILFRKYKRKVVLSSGETRKTFHKNFFYLLMFCCMFSLKKHFIMHVLNNKNYLCKKIIQRKKQGEKHELIVLNAFSESEILWVLFTKNTVRPI